LFTLTLSPLSHGATDLINGGFESPQAAVGGFLLFNDGDDIGGWTSVGSQVAVTNTNFTQNGFAFVAQEGNQWADLSGFNTNNVEGVEQTVVTTPGVEYALSFWVGNVVDTSGTFGSASTVNVYVNGAFLSAATNSDGSGSATQNWKEFVLPFTATSTDTTLRFLNGDPGSDNDNGLDNISLAVTGTNPPPAVPLPAAAAQAGVVGLLLMGVGAAARVRRMRAV
jgi:hypothetical protein